MANLLETLMGRSLYRAGLGEGLGWVERNAPPASPGSRVAEGVIFEDKDSIQIFELGVYEIARLLAYYVNLDEAEMRRKQTIPFGRLGRIGYATYGGDEVAITVSREENVQRVRETLVQAGLRAGKKE